MRNAYGRKSDFSNDVILDDKGVNYAEKDSEDVRYRQLNRRLGYLYNHNYPYHHSYGGRSYEDRYSDVGDIKIQNINDNRNDNQDSIEDQNNEVGNNGNWNEELMWRKFQDISRFDEDIDIKPARRIQKRPHHPYY